MLGLQLAEEERIKELEKEVLCEKKGKVMVVGEEGVISLQMEEGQQGVAMVTQMEGEEGTAKVRKGKRAVLIMVVALGRASCRDRE